MYSVIKKEEEQFVIKELDEVRILMINCQVFFAMSELRREVFNEL